MNLLRTAKLITRNSQDAEDILQEAHVRRYSKPVEIQNENAWYSKAMTRLSMAHTRARSRRGGDHLSYDDDLHASPDDPAHDLLICQLHGMINALGNPHRDVCRLMLIAGMSESDTASSLGIPVGTVKSRLHRGITKLREQVN